MNPRDLQNTKAPHALDPSNEIQGLLDDLGGAVSNLENAALELCTRIAAILSPASPETQYAGPPITPASCEISHVISARISAVAEVTNRLNDTRDRVRV